MARWHRPSWVLDVEFFYVQSAVRGSRGTITCNGALVRRRHLDASRPSSASSFAWLPAAARMTNDSELLRDVGNKNSAHLCQAVQHPALSLGVTAIRVMMKLVQFSVPACPRLATFLLALPSWD